MRFRKKRRARSTAAFDTTPLVDIVFLLVIFFLLTLASPMGLAEVNLPSSMGTGSTLTPNTVTVVVLPEKILIDGKQGSLESLSGLPRDRDIVILASRDIPYFKVIDVLDALRTTGHSRLSLATKPVRG